MWQEWVQNPVTREVVLSLKDRIEEAKDQIVFNYSNAREFDVYVKGMIRAFSEVVEVLTSAGDRTQATEVNDEVSTGDTGTSSNS